MTDKPQTIFATMSLGRRLSLMVAVIALILAFSLQVVGLISSQQQLEAAQRQHASTAAALLAPQVEEALLTGNTYRLPTLLKAASQANPDLRYFAVSRADGSVLAYEYKSRLSRDLAALIKQYSVSGSGCTMFNVGTEDGDVLHLVWPLENGRVGYLHCGYAWAPVDAALRQSCANLLLAMLAGLLLSGLISLAAYRRLARPIGQLVAAARLFGEGKLATRVEERPGARDEAELLANAFNQMAAKLEQHVAEVKRSQSALAHAEKLHVVGQLAAGVAHEINSPLDGAIEASRIMERNAADTEKVVRFAKAQREGLERIAAIVQTLLTFSRQPKTREPRQLLVSQLLNEAQAILKHRVSRKNVALEVSALKTQECAINGDELGLVQVLVNLINNALDATPEGGSIKIDVQSGAEELEISVLDQGTGISADIAPRLFTPFFTTKDVGKGTGLGLATSRNIVEEHGGRIEFRNLTSPWGACFTVFLPHRKDGV